MTYKNTRAFIGAFLITAVCIGGVCGFIAVDLRTERYMPGEFPPIFLISGMDENGVDIAWMGKLYHVDAREARKIQEKLREYRGLIPRTARIAGGFAVWASGI